MSGWSGWGSCSVSCGGGTQSRTRSVTTPASCGGTACGSTSQSQACNTQSCGGCFARGTPVYIDAARTTAIEEVHVGDKVEIYDHVHGLPRDSEVNEVHVQSTEALVAIELEGGDIIEATPYHLFYDQSLGYIRAEDLVAGGKLLTKDNKAITITRVTSRDLAHPVPVYNLGTLTEQPNYFVGKSGVLVFSCNTTDNVRMFGQPVQPHEGMAVGAEGTVTDLHATNTVNLITARHMRKSRLHSSHPGLHQKHGIVLFNSHQHDLTVLTPDAQKRWTLHRLHCARMSKWTKLLGEIDDHLIVLDETVGEVRLIDIKLHPAFNDTSCKVTDDARLQDTQDNYHHSAAELPRRAGGKMNFYSAVIGDHRDIVVTSFMTNEVTKLQLVDGKLVVAAHVQIPSATNEGLNHPLISGDRVYISDVNWEASVKDRKDCLGVYGPGLVHELTLDTLSLVRTVPLGNENPRGMLHMGQDLYVATSGQVTSCSGQPNEHRSALIRVSPDGVADKVVSLPSKFHAAEVFRVSNDLVGVMQFESDHIVIVDIRQGHIMSAHRFAGHHVDNLPLPLERLEPGSLANLSPPLPVSNDDPCWTFTDKKNEVLVTSCYDSHQHVFKLEKVAQLRTADDHQLLAPSRPVRIDL